MYPKGTTRKQKLHVVLFICTLCTRWLCETRACKLPPICSRLLSPNTGCSCTIWCKKNKKIKKNVQYGSQYKSHVNCIVCGYAGHALLLSVKTKCSNFRRPPTILTNIMPSGSVSSKHK